MNLKSGFASKLFGTALTIAVLAAIGSHAAAADLSLPITGNLLGSVVDVNGTPQLGATVQLFNKYQRLIAKTITAADGRFGFAGLPADVYSVRASLASFLPASREKIAIRAGSDSVLQIHLATLFSDIEVRYIVPDGAMTDDWKWVLRSSPATRPITRFLPVDESSNAELKPRVFSGTHAMISMSGGEGGLIDSDSATTDFGTGFALSTNIWGKNQVQVGGTFGQNLNLGSAAIGLAAIYSRSDSGGFGQPPEVTLTMTQFGGFAAGIPGAQATPNSVFGNSSTIRDVSLSVYEVADPFDGLHIEYGMTAESVNNLQSTSRMSPFARATLDLGKSGQVIAAYSDGGRPDELSAHQQYQSTADRDAQSDGDLIDTVNTLARLPQFSRRNGRIELQRTQSYELGYNKTKGSRTYAVSAFYEDVSNGHINVAGNLSALDPGDLMWDGMSTTSTYNIGRYQRAGYIASVNQRMTDVVDVALVYGRMGGFTADGAGSPETWGTGQRFLTEGGHNIAAANVHAHIRHCGTKISAGYGWVDSGAIIPRHVFTTQDTYVAPGLNIDVRQPLPSFFGIPGRFELTANLRNLLAQGYLPFNTGEGRSLLIVQAPRDVRGGLNFIF